MLPIQEFSLSLEKPSSSFENTKSFGKMVRLSMIRVFLIKNFNFLLDKTKINLTTTLKIENLWNIMNLNKLIQ